MSAPRRGLVIFDIDGTLTDTNGVDDECYRGAVGEALDIAPEAIDWSRAAHVTDGGIFEWLCVEHRKPAPDSERMARAQSRFYAGLAAELARDPARFAAIPGAAAAMDSLENAGWSFAVATGAWGPSARMKLGAAGLTVDDALLACADDAVARTDIVSLARRRAERFYDREFARVVSIGDGTWDVKAAAELRLPFIGIGSGERAELLRSAGAAMVLPDYTDLSAFHDALDSAPIVRAAAR